MSLDVNALRAENDKLHAVADVVKRHWHQGHIVGTYHAGEWPEDDCKLCRALVAAGVLTLDQIGEGTRAAIQAEAAS